MTLEAKLTGFATFQMDSADPLVANVIGDIKQRSMPPRSLFSVLPRGGFRYVPLDVVLTSAEHRPTLALGGRRLGISAIGLRALYPQNAVYKRNFFTCSSLVPVLLCLL